MGRKTWWRSVGTEKVVVVGLGRGCDQGVSGARLVSPGLTPASIGSG